MSGFTKKLLMIASVLCMVLAFTTMPARAELTWSADINVSVLDESGRLILGAAPDATDGFENAYENRAIISGMLQVYFYHPEWGVDTPYFWTDIRDTGVPESWEFLVRSMYTGRDTTIRWTTTNLPEGLGLNLVDEFTGDTTDMIANSSYVYYNSSTATRTFRVETTGELPVTPDIAAPDTVITVAPDPVIASSSTEVTFEGSDDVTDTENLEFSHSIDGGEWSPWSIDTTATLSGLNEGPHSFSVKARDEAGNEDATPAGTSFTIDLTPPVITAETDIKRKIGARRMFDVTVSGNVTDSSGQLTEVTYEAHDSAGNYGTGGSVVLDEGGNFTFILSLKKGGRGRGRRARNTLTVTLSAVDAAGNKTTKEIISTLR